MIQTELIKRNNRIITMHHQAGIEDLVITDSLTITAEAGVEYNISL